MKHAHRLRLRGNGGGVRRSPAVGQYALAAIVLAVLAAGLGMTGNDPEAAGSPGPLHTAIGGQRPAHAGADGSTIRGRRGWNPDAPLRDFETDASGLVTVHAEELDRLELHVPAAGRGLIAYLWDGIRFGALPIGATLDPSRGVLTWQPGVGFTGAYHFVLLEGGGATAIRHDVRVVLHPKKSGRVGPQAVIDIPSLGQELTQPFIVAGWAVDLDDPVGPGVDQVQIWAHPLDGRPRVLLGTASYGGARGDIGALHGAAFRNSGFGLEVKGLPPGAYDIAAVARSAAAAGFAPAVKVRVTVR